MLIGLAGKHVSAQSTGVMTEIPGYPVGGTLLVWCMGINGGAYVHACVRSFMRASLCVCRVTWVMELHLTCHFNKLFLFSLSLP